MTEKRKQLEVPDTDPAQQRKLQGALYAEEVKVRVTCRPSSGHRADVLRCFSSASVRSATRCTTSSLSRRSCGTGHWTVSLISLGGPARELIADCFATHQRSARAADTLNRRSRMPTHAGGGRPRRRVAETARAGPRRCWGPSSRREVGVAVHAHITRCNAGGVTVKPTN